jgi:hypothetical protein
VKIIKSIVILILCFIGLSLLVFFDYADRGTIFSKYTPEEELKEFYIYDKAEKLQRAYEMHFNDTLYKFPRHEVEYVKIFRNIPLFSRFTGKKVDKTVLLDFFHNPCNFDWGETTWGIYESHYILRFYDSHNKLVGRIWICFNECGMIESIPFSPTMKFGSLSETGKMRFSKILQGIYNKN